MFIVGTREQFVLRSTDVRALATESTSGLSLIVIYSFVNPARVVQWSALHQEAQMKCSNTSNGSFHTDKQYLCKEVLRLSQLT